MKKWYPCELHCHTLHSDGGFSVKELLEAAKARHLDGICLTDHNTVSGWEELTSYDVPPVLKGIEYTTYHGHMLSLGTEKIIDCFNISSIDAAMRELHEGDGLIGIAHPYQLGTPICTGGRWDYNIKDFSLVNYMEIWSEGEMLMTPANHRAKRWWLSLLDKGYRIAPTFGRDWHRTAGNKLTGACTLLFMDEASPESMKTAIKNGRTQLSLGIFMNVTGDNGEAVGDTVKAGKKTFTVALDSSRAELFKKEYTLSAEKIRIISKYGEAVYEGRAESGEITLTLEKSSYYIFELWGSLNGDDNHLIALTGAIYTE